MDRGNWRILDTFDKAVRLIICLSLFGIGTRVYDGWSASRQAGDYVSKARFEEVLAREEKEDAERNKTMKGILEEIQGIRVELGKINERERMKELYGKGQYKTGNTGT